MFAPNPVMTQALADVKRNEMVNTAHTSTGMGGTRIITATRRRIGLTLISMGTRLDRETVRPIRPVTPARGVS